MTDRLEISSPIEIKDKSVERVAFDLMEKIGRAEGNKGLMTGEQKNREYWLKLYNQCHKVVSSSEADVDDIL